jgi:hypothetical protein
MASYTKKCIYCQKDIKMSDETGKWTPYDKDGSVHDCRDNGRREQQQQQQENQQEIIQAIFQKLDDINVLRTKLTKKLNGNV